MRWWQWRRKSPLAVEIVEESSVHNGENAHHTKVEAEATLHRARQSRAEAQQAARDLRKQRDLFGEAIQRAMGAG